VVFLADRILVRKSATSHRRQPKKRTKRALIFALAALTALTLPRVGASLAQTGYDRPGGDYTSAPVANGDPTVCAARCERDKGCRAWSFSYPPISGGPAMCWLKREVVPARESSCCVSGVRGAGVIEPKAGAIEFSIDRFGGDYRWFETPPDAKGKACAEACQNEPRCRAWTYRRAGYGGASARCFLKDVIKPPRRRPCCISGVVR
jgi:PAN domain-containing protein